MWSDHPFLFGVRTVREPKAAKQEFRAVCFLSREVALPCGEHQLEGDEFSCPPRLVMGEGPVSQRM